MSDDELERLSEAWREQTVDAARFDPVALRARDTAFDRQLRRRNRIELGAAAFVALAFGAIAVVAEPWPQRVGAALVVAGAASVAVTLHRRGTPRPLADLPTLAWRRDTLRQQRDLLRSVASWYLGPLVPGLALMLSSRPWWVWLLSAATFGGIWWINQVAARRLEQQLEELSDVA